ncbi:MASE1 domain-containing protein [Dyella psychrodurans]|uniref:MASE1 domain-containing protein n=1 Tax=Dyella psychrodurans TaxID=1927960 RepID=A0A370X293_9GAMM|nr:MASE1 domain-containing protein [Dyella psychrodurans]RDS82407.1 hypothetical protein DWU99_13415 [Dyella psychrodurans]
MQGGLWANIWVRSFAIAAAYCAAIVLFREMSIPHWIILTGFHLSVLLLTKYKYWPALILGDTVRLAYVSITCYHQFGLLWALVNLLPSTCLMMPVVWLFRERLRIFPKRDSVEMGGLVLCSLLVALIVTLMSLAQILITPLPPGYVIHYDQLIAQLVLGNYLGALTIAPIALVFRQLFTEAHGDWRQWAHNIGESRLLLEGVFLMLPTLTFLVWVGLRDEHARQAAQMAMFLPVVWFALRHGWKGAAFGGTLSSFAIMLLMPERNDHATLQAETLVAMSISTMLLVGARIAVLDRRVEQERVDMRMALALAQRNVHLGEVQLRMTAQALDQIRDSFHDVFYMMLGRLRHLQPAIDDGGYRRQALGMQDQLFRLSDSLYPVQLRERSLPPALREGTIARILDEAEIAYSCDLRGPLSAFSQSIHLAVYRIVCEAIGESCARKNATEIKVRIRFGLRRRPWVVVQVDTRVQPPQVHRIRRDEVVQRLHRITSGLGRKAIIDRAATFEGRVRERSLRHGSRMSILLFDPTHPGG